MPRKRKEQSKPTPACGVRSSAARRVKDLRSIFQKRFAETGSKVRWVAEQPDELPASESGPRLNDAIIAALAEVRRMLPEFVQGLRAIGITKKQVRGEAMKAFSDFRKISAHFISDNTWEELQRNALAAAWAPARKEFLHEFFILRQGPIKQEAAGQPKEATRARPRKSPLSMDELRSALKPAALLPAQAAKALACSQRQLQRMAKAGALKRTAKLRISRDKNLRDALVAVYDEEVVAQVWPPESA